MIEHANEKWVPQKDFSMLEVDNMLMREALIWCDEFFSARDKMNAKIHCAPLRLSPITERVKLALYKEIK